MGGIGLQVGLILFLIVFGGALAGSEIALISLREGQLQRLEQTSGRARLAASLARDPNRFLSAIQVGITLAGFLAASAGGAYFADLLAPSLGFLGGAAAAVSLVLVTLVISYVSLVLGELAPKRIALQRAEGWALRVARPLSWLATAFRPLIWLLSRSTDAVVRVTGGDPTLTKEDMSEDELRDLVESQATFSPEQRAIIGGAFEVAERTLREVVVPRPDVVAVAADSDAHEALVRLVEKGHTRAPVVHGSLDEVVGIVHLADLVDATGPVSSHQRAVIPLPETVRVLDALAVLREQRQHMAVVIDEHGSTEGIVTLEDLLEEIVGEIYDEFDPDSRPVRRRWDGSFELTGRYPVHDLRDLGIELPEGDYTTVAGLVLERLGRIPDPGDHVDEAGWRIVVLAVERRAITRVRLEPNDAPAADDTTTAGAPHP